MSHFSEGWVRRLALNSAHKRSATCKRGWEKTVQVSVENYAIDEIFNYGLPSLLLLARHAPASNTFGYSLEPIAIMGGCFGGTGLAMALLLAAAQITVIDANNFRKILRFQQGARLITSQPQVARRDRERK